MGYSVKPPFQEFTGIHNHSAFSFQDGVATPDELVSSAKERGLRSLAITEHGHTHSHADFYFACKKHDFKGIYGVEAYVIHSIEEWFQLKERLKMEKAARKKDAEADDMEIDLDAVALEDKAARSALFRKGHLVMLAQNPEGLANIYQIVHKAHKYGMYMKPRADKDMLRQHSKGIIASSACMGGVISNKLWALQRGEAEWSEVVREAEEFDDIFGRGKFYLELQFNEHENQKYINEHLIRLHSQTGIPLIVTADAHYVKEDDWEAQQLLHMLMSHKSKRKLTMATLPDDYNFTVRSLYVKSAEQMYEAYLKWNPELPRAMVDEAFANTLLVDSMIDPYNPDTTPRLPTLPFENPTREMADRALEGLKARGLQSDERYTERFLYELGVIKEKGIAAYFLVVKNIVDEAKKTMLIGPGRGSSAGSLLCYLLGITNIDPIEHKLMFERFINTDRIELPDIDLDFEDVDQVKETLRTVFGENNVACISTYSTSQIKGLMKDVARIHDIDHIEVNKANAAIENEMMAIFKEKEGETRSTIQLKLEDIYRLSRTFRSFVERYPQVEKPISRLYGRPRNVGRHASGVVIGDNLPAETAVFYSGSKDERVLQTSFTDGIVGKNLSNMGLVKFDILSLATLKVIRKACELLAKRTGRPIQEFFDEIDPKKMDFNDMKVMQDVFWAGNLTGIFQASQKGMRNLFRQTKPTCFDDVAAIGALYRPGPLGSGMDQMYVRRKHGEEEVTYDHPVLQEILGDTYGCYVYQEHLLEVCRKLGKMSWKDTNRVRKLFLKKDKSKADEYVKAEETELKGKLIGGCVESGLTQQQADDLWVSFGKWGSYGFNAAHAKSYGMVTMQTAYLRAYHPVEFLAAVLAENKTGEIQQDIDDIRRQGFDILPVDINESKDDYGIEENAIRLSLGVVKGVGPAAVAKIMTGQPYTNFLEFLYSGNGSKTSIIPLLKVGAFKNFGETGLLMAQYELFQSMNGKTKKNREKFEKAYFECAAEQVDAIELSFWERELLSFNIAFSPFTMNERERKLQMFVDAGASMTYDEFVESEAEIAWIPVFLKDWKERPQKNKQMFAFMKFGTAEGREFEAPAFSGIWNHVSKILRKGDLYLVAFNKKDGEPHRFIVGKPGWMHGKMDAISYFIRIDDLE